MRRGQNPAKFIAGVHRPARVTVAVLAYVPFLGGFFTEALDVLRACLESLWASTPAPFDLLVFDNGSCREAVDFLETARRAGRIQFLVLSEKNLGKGGAWNIIFRAAPGEIVAYTDSDARFSPGWLERSLEILEGYPRVGMVTARPFRTPPDFMTSTEAWAKATPGVEVRRGRFIPWDDFREFDLSLGQDERAVRDRYESTEDIRLTYRGIEAQVGASHYQFTAYRKVLESFLPFEMVRPMGQVRQLDQRMDESGYLRLMTVQPLVMNLSNSLAPVSAAGPIRSSRRPWVTRAAEWGPLRRLLIGIHDRIFRLYFGGPSSKIGRG